MKKNICRVTALLLVVMMAATGCGSKDDGGNGSKATESTAGNGSADAGGSGGSEDTGDSGGSVEETPTEDPNALPPEQIVDLGGFKFSIVDFEKNRWEPEPGTPTADAILSIIEDVENTFNCDITFESIPPETVFEKVQPAVFADDKYADMIVTTMWAYGRLLGANLMADLGSISTLNLENPWWNKNIIEACTIDSKVLAAAGPFVSHASNAWVMYYNKQIWNELGYEDPYELVRKGEWTYDKFLEFAKGATRDNDGNGVVDSDSDRWGFATPRGDYGRTMYMGMGGRYYANDANGKLTLACADSSAFAIYDFMKQFVQSPGIVWYTGNDHINDCVVMFKENKCLFLGYMAAYGELKNMEAEFGLLPIPKGSVAQEEYIGCVDHNAPIFGVTASNKDKDKVGVVLEAMGRRFTAVEDINLDDWDMTLYRSDDDSEMMREYVAGHGGYDICLIVQNANSTLGAPMRLIWDTIFGGGTSDLASSIESIKDPLMFAMDEFFGIEQ